MGNVPLSPGSEVGAPGDRPVVYTVGHSNVPLQTFISLLVSHHLEVLVDVRSAPCSKYVPHFNGDNLKQAVVRAGIKYLYLGGELGGRPREQHFYDSAGHVRYDLISVSPEFQEGIERLLRGIPRHRCALMCNEEDPTACHRRLLVGRVLSERGVTVLHLRGDGRIQPESELAAQAEPADTQQEFAFVVKEKPEWKSTQSVSRRSPPQSSLEP